MRKICFLICALFLTASFAEAVTLTTRYVRTDCANNGDGTAASCAGAPSGAGAYNALANAFDDVKADFPDMVASDVQVDIDCAGTAADTVTNTAGIEAFLDTLTTDATRYPRVFTQLSNRHDGKWNTGKYRIVLGASLGVIRVMNVHFAKFEGLQIENSRAASGVTSGAGMYIQNTTGTSGFLYVDDTIIRYTGDYTNQTAIGIEASLFGITGNKTVLRNNIIYDFNKGIGARTSANDTIYVYNNIVYSNAASCLAGYTIRGAGGAGSSVDAVNNIAQGSCLGWDVDVSGGAVWTHSNNLSEDTSSPDNTFDSKVVAFVDEGTDDFHLDAADVEALDLGADLSAATESFSTDIDGATRVAPWDLGADEITAAGPGGSGGVIGTPTNFSGGMQ